MAISKTRSEITKELLKRFELEELEGPNTTDGMVSTLKGSLGGIPFWGPFFGEMISLAIPGQRIDRMASYLKLLSEKLGEEAAKSRFTQPGVLDIFSEGARQAANAYVDEKINIISTFVAKSIMDEEVDVVKTMSLASILERINHIEVLILRHCSLNFLDKKKFEEDNRTIFPLQLDSTNPKDIEHKGFIHNCYVNLDSLGLIYLNRRKNLVSQSSGPQITITGAEILCRLGYEAKSSYTYQELIAKEESDVSRAQTNSLRKIPGGSKVNF